MAMYNGRRVIGVAIGGSVVKKSTGKDSVVNVTTDDDVARENTASGNYAIAFGSRNVVSGNESGAIGGLNEVSGQDALVFGYRGNAQANQSLTGGYRCTNQASESIQVGNNLVMSGTITEDEDGDPRSDSGYNAQFGQGSTMGVGTHNCLMSGHAHMQGAGAYGTLVSGGGHRIGNNLVYSQIGGETDTVGNNCDSIDVFGKDNTVGNYNEKVLIRGNNNTTQNGSNSSKRTGIYILGDDCDENYRSNVVLIGNGLKPNENNQYIMGRYNKGTSDAWFEVGCGSANNNRDTAFAVITRSGEKIIKVGNTELTEAQLQALLALLS